MIRESISTFEHFFTKLASKCFRGALMHVFNMNLPAPFCSQHLSTVLTRKS